MSQVDLEAQRQHDEKLVERAMASWPEAGVCIPPNPNVEAWHWIETGNGAECIEWTQTPAGWRWFAVGGSYDPEAAAEEFPSWCYLCPVVPPGSSGCDTDDQTFACEPSHWRPLPPAPGANPLDTPDVHDAVYAAVAGVVEAHGEAAIEAMSEREQAEAAAEVVGAVLLALAPHVLAVERDTFRHGREAGRDDAVQACRRYAAREREAGNAAHDMCDDAEEADCERDARVAEALAQYIELLGPVEDAEEPEEQGVAAEVDRG